MPPREQRAERVRASSRGQELGKQWRELLFGPGTLEREDGALNALAQATVQGQRTAPYLPRFPHSTSNAAAMHGGVRV